MILLNKAKDAISNPRPLILAVPLLLLPAAPITTVADDSASIKDCEIIIDDLADGIDSGWTSKSFKGMTEYTWVKDGEKNFIRATSHGSASSLYYKIQYDLGQYPYITWQWKVDSILASGDATKKSFDDYGARIYIVFPSLVFWNTKTINYIWANRLPKEKIMPSAYTKNSIMISVQSGRSETGKWIIETRNVHEDYKRAFGKEPPQVGGIAIMTDSDDTGENASASYGPIGICSHHPGK